MMSGEEYAYDEYTYDDEMYEEMPMVPMPNYHASEALQKNLLYLRKAITEGNVYEVQNLYENQLAKLIDQYGKRLPPPHAPEIKHLFEEGGQCIFSIIYSELYHRHVIASSKPTIQERFESYHNYVNLFNYILTNDGPVSLELPNQWLWEIMDDFIYQFQSFSVFRSKVDKLTDEEVELCRSNPKMWNVHMVLNVLHSLVQKSNINQQVQYLSEGKDPGLVAGDYGSRPLYKMLGYFSLIGLSRLHSQLGDYYQAIKVLEHLELNKKSLYSRVPACQVATYYYVGFAYMMMRRYEDALRTFSSVLMYIMRTKPTFVQRQYQMQIIAKQTDQMLSLLAICMVLHPQRLDESILEQLKDKQAENMVKMQQADISTFEELFSFACPKFLSPVSPFSYEHADVAQLALIAKNPLEQQLKVFREEVQSQLHIPTIRSFLKLYTTMPVEKLAKFILQMNPDHPLREATDAELTKHCHRQLISFKHLMHNMTLMESGTQSNSSSLAGEFQTSSDMDFFIDKDMIHIADTKVAAKYGEFFIKAYHKFHELHGFIKSLQPLP